MNKAVLNPKTGRKVSVNSSLGKKILNDYSQNGGNPIFFEIMTPNISPRMLNRSPNHMNPVRHSPNLIINQKIASTCSRCRNLSMLKKQIDSQLKNSCTDCEKLVEIKSDRDRITKLARHTLQKNLKNIRERLASPKPVALSPQSPESPEKPARKSSLRVGLKLKDMAKSLSEKVKSKKSPKKSPVKTTKKTKSPVQKSKAPKKTPVKTTKKTKSPKKSPVRTTQKSKAPKNTPKSKREKSPKKSSKRP